MTFWPRVWERILSNNQPQVRVYTHKMMICHMSHVWQWILWHTSNPAKLRYEHDWVRWHNQWAKTYSKTLTVRILIFQTHKREHCWIRVEFKMDGMKLYGPLWCFLSVQIDGSRPFSSMTIMVAWSGSSMTQMDSFHPVEPSTLDLTQFFKYDWLLSRYCISNRRLKL